MASTPDKKHPDGSLDAPALPGGGETAGGVITPIEAFLHDAGAGVPPPPGTYGRPSEYMYPTSGKKAGGTGGALKAFLKGHGGGKP